jgi:hypothetical protein
VFASPFFEWDIRPYISLLAIESAGEDFRRLALFFISLNIKKVRIQT